MKLTRTFTLLVCAIVATIALLAFSGPAHAGDLLGLAGAGDWASLAALPLAGATKSKFFRVATEGATTDGRAISRDWIEQMAKNFNRAKYGARVWLEHYRGIAPDGLFKAYGDVLALEARDVEGGKKALFAQIEPLPELVAMNKAGQKIYTSIEVHPKFADTGEAYMVGLAVTDSPASLGTEVLSFAAQHPGASPFAGRKSSPDTLFSAATEAEIELEADDAPAPDPKAFSEHLKGILAKAFGRHKADSDQRFADVAKGMEDIATAITEQAAAQGAAFADLQDAHDQLAANLAELQKQHAELLAQLDHTPERHSQRPTATGGAGAVLTDC